jgi:vesicle coat complex subunit
VSILERLSSARGDPSEASNKVVAAEALTQPEILDEVAAGLAGDDPKLLGDCAEVFTEVAKEAPALVAPYVDRLVPLLGHRDTRVRWEATHAVALVAALVPDRISPLLPDLAAKIQHDRSVIVRDSAVKALGEYGRSGPQAAREAFPLLRDALAAWEGKHAKLVLEAMSKLGDVEPALRPEVQAAAQRCLDHKRANVRRLAEKLVGV